MVPKSINDIENKIDSINYSNKENAIKLLNKIINQIPKEYSNLINEAFNLKRVPKEYLLSSMLFAISTSTGLTFQLNALGYKNYANLYFAIIGSRGDAKSEAMKIATEPLKEKDDEDYNNNIDELKNSSPETEDTPIRKQILLQNASIEAVHKIHSENPNSIGVSIDEIYTLIEKMGNSSSRDGIAWRTFLLEGYTNGHVDISRKTTDSFRILKTYPTLLGGLQHQFVSKLLANGNLESGFIDRLLFTPKLTNNDILSKGGISPETIDKYKQAIMNILAYKRQSERKEETIKQFNIELADNAEDKVFKYVQKLIKRQSSTEYILKEYMSKMQISIHKLCLLIHIMKNSINSNFRSVITLDTVELAIQLNEFFFLNFKIVIQENTSKNYQDPTLMEIIKLAKKNGAQQKDVVAITGFNKGTVSKKWNIKKTYPQLAT